MKVLYRFGYFCTVIILLCMCTASVAQPLTVDAGSDQTLCPNSTVTLGGTPTALGGLPPYTYSWSPPTGLSSTSVANPVANPSEFTIYTVTVTDDTGAVHTDIVSVTLSYLFFVGAGAPINFCLDSAGLIGGTNSAGQGVTYSWAPLEGLNDSTSPQPIAQPKLTTTYTLTATITGCQAKIDSVTVTVVQPPPIFAGNDTTIKEGSRLTLEANGGYFYEWTSAGAIMYPNTAKPDVEPIIATTYYLYGTDAIKRCHAYDTITVFVDASNDIVIYNTFTPNADGNNDTWYIGNILKYPDSRLEVYNRNGKLVYRTLGYANLWDGKSFLGEDLPAAPYFYILDLGNGSGTFHGTVTIVK
jgi:gliding motility-associated-like protein